MVVERLPLPWLPSPCWSPHLLRPLALCVERFLQRPDQFLAAVEPDGQLPVGHPACTAADGGWSVPWRPEGGVQQADHVVPVLGTLMLRETQRGG